MNKEYYKSGNTLIFIIYSLFFLRYSFRQACLPLLVPTPTPFRFLAVLCTAFPIRHKKNNSFRYYFWCLLSESNQGHRDFQSLALPTELSRHYLSLKIKKHHLYKMATRKGLEPSTSSVTG